MTPTSVAAVADVALLADQERRTSEAANGGGASDRPSDQSDDVPTDRTCAQCSGAIDGTERLVSVSGHAAWLHLECERFWVRALKERSAEP